MRTVVIVAGCAWLAVLGCARPVHPTDAPAPFSRPVVISDAPVSLSNPQQNPVTWPIWGSAFALGETVSARMSLEAGTSGGTGLMFAGPGAPKERRAIELAMHGGRWALRETAGGALVQEVPIEAAGNHARLILELAPEGRSARVTGHGGTWSMEAMQPLARLGEAVGVYVHLEPGSELSIRELALTQPLPRAPRLGTPLRQAANAHGLALGTATDVWPPRHDLGFEALLGEQFNAIAPTELYWATTRGEDQDYFFVPADLMVNYANIHQQAVTGYFLVWDYELPAWLPALAERGGSSAIGAALDEHVATLVERYRGRVHAWVVVNEAVWGPDETGGEAGYAESLWLEELGPAYIERAFYAARAADPGAVLLYNETGAEALGAKSDFVYELMSDFVARGVPIDGIGLQLHIDAAAPPDLVAVKANMERLGALGLDVHITELDVSLANLGGTEAAQLERQAAIYGGVLGTCRAVPACRGYTVFGFSDIYAWDELGDASPLIFDEQYRPKPAFFAIQGALN